MGNCFKKPEKSYLIRSYNYDYKIPQKCTLCQGTKTIPKYHVETTYCKRCKGEGNIVSSIIDHSSIYEYVQVCPECKGEPIYPIKVKVPEMCYKCRGMGFQ